MYDVVIIALTISGLLLSAFFVLTWIPSAARSLIRGTLPKRFSKLEVIDITGLPLGIFLLYSTSVYNLTTLGVTPAPTFGVKFARILTVVLFDFIVGLRAYRWALILRSGAPAVEQSHRDAFSEQTKALEGTNGSTSTYTDPG